jgi:hypothetical protein
MTVDMCPPIDPTVAIVLTFTDTDDEAAEVTVPPDCTGDEETPWWWNSLSWPFFDYRYGYAPPSAWLPGNVLLSAVPGESSIPISLVVSTPAADGQAGLASARQALEAAFTAGDLTLQFLMDADVAGEWQADPAVINWGPVSVLTLGMFTQEGAVVVPVNPVEAT